MCELARTKWDQLIPRRFRAMWWRMPVFVSFTLPGLDDLPPGVDPQGESGAVYGWSVLKRLIQILNKRRVRRGLPELRYVFIEQWGEKGDRWHVHGFWNLGHDVNEVRALAVQLGLGPQMRFEPILEGFNVEEFQKKVRYMARYVARDVQSGRISKRRRWYRQSQGAEGLVPLDLWQLAYRSRLLIGPDVYTEEGRQVLRDWYERRRGIDREELEGMSGAELHVRLKMLASCEGSPEIWESLYLGEMKREHLTPIKPAIGLQLEALN